jgi:ribonuclease HI
MYNFPVIAISKIDKIDDYHLWKYNIAYSGENISVKTYGDMHNQLRTMIDYIYQHNNFHQMDRIIILNNQISSEIISLITTKYPNIIFSRIDSTYSKSVLRNVFDSGFLHRMSMIPLESNIKKNSRELHISTDAAGGEDFPRSYSGWFYKENSKPYFNVKQSVLSNTLHVELEAIFDAILNNYENTNYDKIVIHSDSDSAIKALGVALEQNRIPNNINHPLLIDMLIKCKVAMKNKDISIASVPAHSRYAPNETIDSLLTFVKRNYLSINKEVFSLNIHALSTLLAGAFYSSEPKTYTQREPVLFEPKTLIASHKNGTLTTFLSSQKA